MFALRCVYRRYGPLGTGALPALPPCRRPAPCEWGTASTRLRRVQGMTKYVSSESDAMDILMMSGYPVVTNIKGKLRLCERVHTHQVPYINGLIPVDVGWLALEWPIYSTCLPSTSTKSPGTIILRSSYNVIF